jgi:DNA polymerase I-like protein with 3'-5' exonuclease and polymerase domains
MHIALDTETFLIGPGNVIPKLVCTSASFREEDILNKYLFSTVDDNSCDTITDAIDNHHTIFHNCGFDLTVFVRKYPNLIPIIFKALEEGRIHDTIIREKLLMLSTHGGLTTSPQGTQLRYSLADLAKKYLGIDMSSEKEDEDSWRYHYSELYGKPVSEYPKDAYDYAIDDAAITLKVFEAQEQEVRTKDGYASLSTEYLHVNAAFCLQLMTAWGFRCDLKRKEKLQAKIEKQLSPENLNLLTSSGILRPPVPAKPYANRARDKDGNLKLKKPVKESVDTKLLKARIEYICNQNELEVIKTEPSTKYPEGSVSANAEVLKNLQGLDDVLDQYHLRSEWQSVLTRELPHMNGKVIHSCYDPLKSTGRTSSYASKLFPSSNVQSKDPRVRPCFVARKGTLLYSVDYSSLELCTFADTQFQLFGSSLLRDIINNGIDPHAYLGSQLAYNLDKKFRKSCKTNDVEKVLEIFCELKKTKFEYFKEWRTFAKPVGLGFPGGLGPQTMVAFAKATYGIVMSIEEARLVRSIWLASFPEASLYFEFIKEKCADPNIDDKYRYTSPSGFHRAGCTYSAACNGLALQTPAAEGFKTAICNLVRACYDPSINSTLYGTHPIGAIHDEVVGEIPDDSEAHERVEEIQKILEKSMAQICPSVTIRTEACLMRRWHKEAQPVFDSDNRLIPWIPKVKKKKFKLSI